MAHNLNIRLPDDVFEKLEALARARGISKADLIRMFIMERHLPR